MILFTLTDFTYHLSNFDLFEDLLPFVLSDEFCHAAVMYKLFYFFVNSIVNLKKRKERKGKRETTKKRNKKGGKENPKEKKGKRRTHKRK